jgi:hypothetical protein
MSIYVRWPEDHGRDTIGLNFIQDKDLIPNQVAPMHSFWIPNDNSVHEVCTKSKSDLDDTYTTFVMSDKELGNLITAYAIRKGVLK